MEILRNNNEIREMTVSEELNPNQVDISEIITMLFGNQHFLNLLGEVLTYKPGTSKLERFFVQQVRNKLNEMRTDMKIESAFSTLNQKIQARLNRLKETQFLAD